MSRRKRSTERFAQGGLVSPSGSPKHPSDEVQRIISQQLAMTNSMISAKIASGASLAFGPAATSGNFSGSEFVMGTAVGVRSWDVDKLGRLVSPSFPMVWPPTEVVAECRRSRDTWSVVWSPTARYQSVTPPTAETAPGDEQQHSQSSCSCGFYAYYEGHNDYANEDRVTGVIEGYGETQIGTRGFKCAKARIVALYVPQRGTNERLIGETKFDRVRANYGGKVAIFDDYARMAAEFPTTAPEAMTTPDTDPDFWTRGIA